MTPAADVPQRPRVRVLPDGRRRVNAVIPIRSAPYSENSDSEDSDSEDWGRESARDGGTMLQVTVSERTYLLAADATMERTKQDVLEAMRTAPAFLSLTTVLGGRVEVLLTAASSVVLELHDEAPLPTAPHGDAAPDYDDLYGVDYL